MKKLISILLCCVLIITATACQKPDVPLTAAELLDLGEKYLLDLNYEQALVQFLKVIEVEPMNARAYLAAAEVYINIGDVDKAIAVLVQGASVVDDSGITARLEGLTVTEDVEPEIKPEPRFRQDPNTIQMQEPRFRQDPKTVQGYVPEPTPEPTPEAKPEPKPEVKPEPTPPQTSSGTYIAPYTYLLPDVAPAHNYYNESFSTSHEFRDIFITQFGRDKAAIYDMVAHVLIEMLYNDTLEYGKEITIIGFGKMATVSELGSALLAVERDMPFLSSFISVNAGGISDSYDYDCLVTRAVLNYFADDAPKENNAYIAMRNRVANELRSYRSAVAGVSDDVEKIEIAAGMFTENSVYDSNATYHGISALLTKRGIGGSSNWAFAMIGNAVGVPTYTIHGGRWSLLFRPNNGKLMVVEISFGQGIPEASRISDWPHRNQVTWDSKVFNFLGEHYFPTVDMLQHMGGLS